VKIMNIQFQIILLVLEVSGKKEKIIILHKVKITFDALDLLY